MKELKYPPYMQWEVTSECNHNCIHCYNYWRKDEELIEGMSHFLSEEEYLNIAKKIIQFKPVAVTITGGEPFIVFERIKKAAELLLSSGIQVSFNTNAALLNDNIIEFLLKNNISLFVSFPGSGMTTFDSIVGRENAFRDVLKSLDVAAKKGVRFNTNVVVSKLNINELKDIVFFLKKRYNISGINITRVGKPINSDSTFDKFILDKEDLVRLQNDCVYLHKELDIAIATSCPFTPCSLYSQDAFDLFGLENICTAGRTSYAIDTSGNLKACPRDSTLYGNILREDFSVIWKRLIEWRNMSLIPVECKDCTHVSHCLGGCRVDSYPFTGKKDSLDTISNPNNVPIKFKKKKTCLEQYSDESVFLLSDKIIYVEEEDCIRASVGKLYIYLTSSMYSFLRNRNSFSLKDFSTYFNVSTEVARNAVYSLVTKKIVKMKFE